MKYLILTLLGMLMFLVIGNAQSLNTEPTNNLIPSNRIFVEILGVPNTFISINYERALFTSQKNSFELTARTGFGYSYFRNYNSHLYSVPFELNGLIGGEILKLDVGIGYVKQYILNPKRNPKNLV